MHMGEIRLYEWGAGVIIPVTTSASIGMYSGHDYPHKS